MRILDTEHYAAERDRLETLTILSERNYRVLFLGASVNGSTDIVSCIYRALVNLGHHVLNIDTKVHRDILDNPERLRGGRGPIYVKFEAIEQMVDQFKPHFIVCCAGGLGFTPEDAEALKRKGVILVGITLSDPDVQDSVMRFAGEFDFHATNALLSREAYLEAGHRNTLYFPFGIDRGFITQKVPPAPELAADVVCIGHATSRPERNDVMGELAERFDVKTYGRGWKIEGSEVVEGPRMVQASRAGLIHVNFPGTRAGYTNVKCGVFETIASGGLLVTEIFDEMANFFTYDEEIVGYRDLDHLQEQIAALLAEPDRLRRIAKAGFDKLLSHHLYEHRWLALFEDIEQRVAQDAAEGDARAQAMAQTLATFVPPARRVLVSGFYGARNIGDDLLLESIAGAIEDNDPAMQVVVGAETPKWVERISGRQAFRRRDNFAAADEARNATAIVVGGGGLWHDYTYRQAGGLASLVTDTPISLAGFAALPLMGRVLDVPFYGAGLGVGPLEEPEAKAFVKYVASHAEKVWVRDDASADLLRSVVDGKVEVIRGEDPVLGLKLPEARPHPVLEEVRKGRKLVLVNLRHWGRGGGGAALTEALGEALGRIAAEHDIVVAGLPMQIQNIHDPSAIEALFDRLPDDVETMMLDPEQPMDEVFSAISSADAVVAMRLHACLLAHRYHVPTLGLAYDPKVSQHFEEIGRGDFAVPIDTSAEDLYVMLDKVLREQALPDPVLERIAALEDRSHAALASLAKDIAAAPVRPVVMNIPQRRDEKPVAKAAPVNVQQPLPLDVHRLLPEIRTVKGVRSRQDAPPLDHDHRQLKDGLKLWLRSTNPEAGDYIEAHSEVALPQADAVEMEFSVVPPVLGSGTAHLAGRMLLQIEIGNEAIVVHDFEATSIPLQVRYRGKRVDRLKIVTRLLFARDVRDSTRWPMLARVHLTDFKCRSLFGDILPGIAVLNPAALAVAGEMQGASRGAKKRDTLLLGAPTIDPGLEVVSTEGRRAGGGHAPAAIDTSSANGPILYFDGEDPDRGDRISAKLRFRAPVGENWLACIAIQSYSRSRPSGRIPRMIASVGVRGGKAVEFPLERQDRRNTVFISGGGAAEPEIELTVRFAHDLKPSSNWRALSKVRIRALSVQDVAGEFENDAVGLHPEARTIDLR